MSLNITLHCLPTNQDTEVFTSTFEQEIPVFLQAQNFFVESTVLGRCTVLSLSDYFPEAYKTGKKCTPLLKERIYRHLTTPINIRAFCWRSSRKFFFFRETKNIFWELTTG